MGTEGQRKTVLRAELCQHGLCFRLGIDRGLQIPGDLHVLAVIGARPAPVGFGLIDLPQAVFGHPAFPDQAGDIVDIDLAPDTFLCARRVALQKALVVKPLAQAIDPAPAQDNVDRLLRRDRFEP